ncbi:MAG: hypothetical protein HYU03_04450, partial [Thaumarchaeota archaeon]|nr:hypothetical protein [Nitrososphaerota archaeon]
MVQREGLERTPIQRFLFPSSKSLMMQVHLRSLRCVMMPKEGRRRIAAKGIKGVLEAANNNG